jgi:dynein heavy chain
MVPTIFEQLIVPRYHQIDAIFMTGCLVYTWVSPNLNEYCDSIYKEIENLDLLFKRANDMVVYRIDAVLNDMTNIVLCEINENEPIAAEEFLEKTEKMCEIGASNLQIKSNNIEDATEELIMLLYPEYNRIEEKLDEFEYEKTETKSSFSHNDGTNKSVKMQRSQSQMTVKKKREARSAMHEIARELFHHFNHKNSDAIVKLVKTTLEKLKKRITSSQQINYTEVVEKEKKDVPSFKCYAVLSKPHVLIKPTLEEIQQTLNKSVQVIVSVSKHVNQWSKGEIAGANTENVKKPDAKEIKETKETKDDSILNDDLSEENDNKSESRPDTPTNSLVAQKNYYKAVSENKDIAKMISQLNTCITSSKKDVLNAIDRFKEYQFIWQKDRDDDLKQFLSTQPRVSEFEIKIREFEFLINEINDILDYFSVGPIALMTEMIKQDFTNEILTWKSNFGLACNQKYKKEIIEISMFIDEVYKKLQREIRDLDDIRHSMAALKLLRENDIRIDMTIIPIEESYTMLQRHHIEIPREEIEKCDTLRYNWQRLLQISSQTTSNLLDIQVLYKDGLKNDVKDFGKQCTKFYNEYNKVCGIIFCDVGSWFGLGKVK